MRERTVKAMIVVMLLLAIAVYFVSGTYARYASTASGTASVDVAKWAVKINGEDIVPETATLKLNDWTVKTNTNVAEGHIAPSSVLYTDLVIDTTGTEVAVDYSLTLGAIEGLVGDEAIAIQKVVLVGADDAETPITGSNGVYTGSIALADVGTPVTVRVYVEWTNNDTDTTIDTAAGVAASTLSIEVTAEATQHI